MKELQEIKEYLKRIESIINKLDDLSVNDDNNYKMWLTPSIKPSIRYKNKYVLIDTGNGYIIGNYNAMLDEWTDAYGEQISCLRWKELN